jgi:hypothetical protein
MKGVIQMILRFPALVLSILLFGVAFSMSLFANCVENVAKVILKLGDSCGTLFGDEKT